MKIIARGTPEWGRFVVRQRRRIRARIQRYLSVKMAKLELTTTGNLSLYRSYKSETVAPLLTQVMTRIRQGKYGICVVCQGEIPIERLEVVPGALACVGCDDKR